MHKFKKGDSDYHELINENFAEIESSVNRLDETAVLKANLLDAVYPVGAIYQSAVLIDIEKVLGGTWTRIQGRFLVAASDSDTDFLANKTGGSKYIASHVHTVGKDVQTTAVESGALVASKSNFTGTPDPSTTIQLPPYMAVYMWRRTA